MTSLAAKTPDLMTAVLHTRYGSASDLDVGETPVPAIGEDDVLIRVEAAAIQKGDWHVMTGLPYLIRAAGYGLARPKNPILGQELAGRVVGVGKNVVSFRPGDEVFGEVSHGAFAEFVCASPEEIALKPSNLNFEQAAALPSSGLVALKALEEVANVQPGQRVLINGASGGVGTSAVQLAKHLGAEVTAVCSTRNLDLVQSIGADHTIDYTREDFAAGPERYDVLLDLVGNRSIADCRRTLTETGIYIASSGRGGNWLGPIGRILGLMCVSKTSSQTMTFLAPPDKSRLAHVCELAEAEVLVPVIGKGTGLDGVPEALAHQGTGHAQGKTVVRF